MFQRGSHVIAVYIRNVSTLESLHDFRNPGVRSDKDLSPIVSQCVPSAGRARHPPQVPGPCCHLCGLNLFCHASVDIVHEVGVPRTCHTYGERENWWHRRSAVREVLLHDTVQGCRTGFSNEIVLNFVV